MAEMDPLERRVADALAWYAAHVSPAVDAGAVAHRVALEHPRRRAGALSWRAVTVPRGAWILLLLAGLLIALVGGMLVAGSQVHRNLWAVVPPVGQAFHCPPGQTPDEPGPIDQARPAFTQTVAFDRRAGKLVAVTAAGGRTETWTFDVCTNTWERMHPSAEPPNFQWARLAYEVDSDATILVAYESATVSNVWVYDLQANTWTHEGAGPTDPTSLAYDPLSGLVVAAAGGKLWNYDGATETWTPISQANPTTGPGWPGGTLTYDASVDRIIVATAVGATGGETWLFDLRNGRWSRSQAVKPHVLDWLTLPAIAYDEAAERTVVGGNVRLAAYDATADRWETVEFPGQDAWHGVSLVYDPVNQRLVVLPDSWESWTTGATAGVVALDLVTREWTVLLEPSPGQPASP